MLGMSYIRLNKVLLEETPKANNFGRFRLSD